MSLPDTTRLRTRFFGLCLCLELDSKRAGRSQSCAHAQKQKRRQRQHGSDARQHRCGDLIAQRFVHCSDVTSERESSQRRETLTAPCEERKSCGPSGCQSLCKVLTASSSPVANILREKDCAASAELV